jgi:hypothetical protein
MSNVRPRMKSQKVKTRLKGQKFASQFRPQERKDVVYVSRFGVPREVDTRLRTVLAFSSANVTAAIIANLFTNSLLQTASSFTIINQGDAVVNMLRNYQKYRVMSYEVRGTISSRALTATKVAYEIHAPDLPPVVTTGSLNVQNSALRDRSFVHLIPSQACSPCVVKFARKYHLTDIVGNNEYEQDDTYAGSASNLGVAVAPVDLTYLTLAFSAFASNALFTANECPDLQLELIQYVKLYDPRV